MNSLRFNTGIHCSTSSHVGRSRCSHVVQASAQAGNSKGKCYLVGAGPGSSDYLTLKAARLISQAKLIVYDDLGTQEALSLAQPTAQLVYVGKRGGNQSSMKQHEIDQLLVELCSQGQDVVRLKGGCPSVFSRVASEMSALTQAGCTYELVPGVSSALAAPLMAGFPLTHAQLSTSFAVVSGHDVNGTDWSAFKDIPTVVILMAGKGLVKIASLLQQHKPSDTPVALVHSAGTPRQQVWRSSLGSLATDVEGKTLSPCVCIIGQVAASTQ